jgi:peptidoglycan/xylan/chitin deacetylase (PgdA/CDA1 family)
VKINRFYFIFSLFLLFVAGAIFSEKVFSSESIIPTFLFEKNSFDIGPEKRPRLISYVRVNRPVVVLTFDDGPKPGYSEDILDILEFYGIRATFFVVGKLAKENSEIIQRMLAQGNEVGNHTYDHLRLANLSEAEVIRQLNETNLVIGRIAGKAPRFFRAPGGHFTWKTLQLAAEHGLIGVGWSVNAGDYVAENGEVPRMSSLQLARKIINHCRPGDIILLHNGGTVTREALPLIIKGLQDKNYSFVTVGELLNLSLEKNGHAG